ncbi:MAG: hypothetical protein A3H51_01440 [Candidatus Spechtbacteria bacterium RIFCSPLOWO2_02_FULL_38_8]|uniref:TIGR04372 family glycosyltransferase n=1 Tax=Candidatus Spechtbacteria bacterium RIFCSPLOWO2_02_FULL_38_8 TaxID=1802164 RepID=A0A1G2HGA6_9BACT|nr:MAG: hypothetical protein A3H51_01440 [Candidatus Spechtbacteria bacterium RIFCSPLOWO2_02_FULL_38_8]
MKNFFLKCIHKLWQWISYLFALPIAIFFIFLYPFHKIKLIGLISDRIGHYALNTELLLCYIDDFKKKEESYFFYLREAPICNQQLHTMWKRIIPIFPLIFAHLTWRVDYLMSQWLGKKYKNDSIQQFEITKGNVDKTGVLKKHAPHLFFTELEKKRGQDLLRALGMPSDAKWACLLVRDAAYLNQYLAVRDWSYHFHRNADIDNFSKAALFLAEKGYYVLRMGKAVEKKFSLNHPRVIDYANHACRSDFADVYLSAHCAFFISTSSGLDGIPEIFRKPVVFADMSFIRGELQFWYPGRFFIFKKVWGILENRFVSLREIHEKISSEDNLNAKLAQLQWQIIENTPDEILAVVQEMENSLYGSHNNDNPMHALLKTTLPFPITSQRDYLYFHPEQFYIRVGEDFFNENQSIIADFEKIEIH